MRVATAWDVLKYNLLGGIKMIAGFGSNIKQGHVDRRDTVIL